jgi:hypothetical protein
LFTYLKQTRHPPPSIFAAHLKATTKTPQREMAKEQILAEFNRINDEAQQYHEFLKENGWEDERLKTKFLFEVLRELELVEEALDNSKEQAWIIKTLAEIDTTLKEMRSHITTV